MKVIHSHINVKRKLEKTAQNLKSLYCIYNANHIYRCKISLSRYRSWVRQAIQRKVGGGDIYVNIYDIFALTVD